MMISHTKIREGITALSQLILGANSLIQSALPAILNETPASFHKDTMKQLEVGRTLLKIVHMTHLEISCERATRTMHALATKNLLQFQVCARSFLKAQCI